MSRPATAPAPITKRPNILFIVTDDMGAWAMGSAGHPDARTPHLDRLASEGTLLRQHFSASAVCSPSRACIFTSRHCLEVGIPDFLCQDPEVGLDPQVPSIASELKAAGYDTTLIGKWHLGHGKKFHPTRHGYNEFTGFLIGDDSGPLSSRDPVIEKDGRRSRVPGYTSDLLADYAIDFLRRDRASPFFLSLHFWAPHANQGVSTEDGDRTWHPLKSEDWDLFKDIDPQIPNPDYPKLDIPRVKRMTREYLASVHSVDRNIGRVLAQLEAQGILDDTLIVFTSDNGYNLGHHGIWHKGNGWWILTDNRGDRPNLYDESMRVPALVRFPEKVKAGQDITSPNSSLDWLPTLLDYAGVNPSFTPRGQSLRAPLSGADAGPLRTIFGQYRMWDWNQTGADMRSWRTQEWKLMVDLKETVPNEFYALHRDPCETTNLASSDDPAIRAAMRECKQALYAYMKQIGDTPVPVYN
ncbi:sulfatase-like hydrolase/transferase [Ruficoccus amylovorans]|uniref:Sulfatase-like hydrolase/transferase n=1 Tax=Ruficoccus amylovorans TaxID=1804625 RepID=A0A842HE73_9BACT|nr:sulfatase-like hydrolase/transferase [Ruficoccus amylovorans]MBC2593877.1 sulfatase-like hydrolase/transferase [Ruficoccus amylovorans]